MQFNAGSRIDYPAIGDWVIAELPGFSDRGVIHQVLKRKTTVHRKEVGSSAELQILATNVDYAFIASAANSDLNFRRIERYLAVAWESGAVPVILLTKADTTTSEAEVRHGLRKQNKILPAADRKIWKKRSLEAKNGRSKKGDFSW